MNNTSGVATTVSTRSYVMSHDRQPGPRQRGYWIFENTATGAHSDHDNVTYAAAVRALPAGEWKLMP